MLIEGSQSVTTQESESIQNFKDFEIGSRVKKITTHDLYELKRGSKSYIAKLFKIQFRKSFEKELNALKTLKHPNIIELVYYQYSENQYMGLWNCDMIILKNATHGSLNEYVPLNGKMDEKTARTIFKQIISAVKYAAELSEDEAIVHPNLLPSSVLLDEKRSVKICGWSKLTEKEPIAQQVKQLLFNCCEILILMLTSYMPFYKKNSNTDPLFKFLKPTHIAKFWLNLIKRVVNSQKDFTISDEAKELIQKVFLGEWSTFKQVEDSKWMQGEIHESERLNQILQQKEEKSRLRREQAHSKLNLREEKKRKILQEYEEDTLNGSQSRSSGGQYDFFIQDYYDNFFNLEQEVKSSECSELIRLYDNRPNFIIASFKQNLRSLEDNEISLMLGSEFKLIGHFVEKIDNVAYLELKFEETTNYGEEEDSDDIVQIGVKAEIRFFKNNQNHLFAEIKIMESNLSEYYANLIMSFIENRIKLQ